MLTPSSLPSALDVAISNIRVDIGAPMVSSIDRFLRGFCSAKLGEVLEENLERITQ